MTQNLECLRDGISEGDTEEQALSGQHHTIDKRHESFLAQSMNSNVLKAKLDLDIAMSKIQSALGHLNEAGEEGPAWLFDTAYKRVERAQDGVDVALNAAKELLLSSGQVDDSHEIFDIIKWPSERSARHNKS